MIVWRCCFRTTHIRAVVSNINQEILNMKIKVGNLKVDSKTLIRFEWRKYYPKLIVHEKFEKQIKWILRTLALIGIVVSFLVLPYYVGIIVTIVLFTVQTLIEKTMFEYSVMIVQPFPDFKIDYDQWITNGYFLTNAEVEGHENYPNYFGPAYTDAVLQATYLALKTSVNEKIEYLKNAI